MLSISQFILHFFHRKKGKKSDDSDLQVDQRILPQFQEQAKQKEEDSSVAKINRADLQSSREIEKPDDRNPEADKTPMNQLMMRSLPNTQLLLSQILPTSSPNTARLSSNDKVTINLEESPTNREHQQNISVSAEQEDVPSRQNSSKKLIEPQSALWGDQSEIELTQIHKQEEDEFEQQKDNERPVKEEMIINEREDKAEDVRSRQKHLQNKVRFKVTGMIMNTLRYLYSVAAFILISQSREQELLILTGGLILVFWVIEVATMLIRVQDFQYGNKKCKMVSYVKNVFRCKNKGDYQNRAVFSNNVFFLFTLALLVYLAVIEEQQSERIFFGYLGLITFIFYFGVALILSWKPVAPSYLQKYSVFDYSSGNTEAQLKEGDDKTQFEEDLKEIKATSKCFCIFFCLAFLGVLVLAILISIGDIIEQKVHLAGMIGVMSVFLLLLALAKRMQSIGPFFRKVGTISLILVWVFLFTPFFSIVGLVTAFKEQAQFIESIIFTFIILGLFLLMAFVNENIKRFHHESQARTIAVTLKNSLKKEAVKVANILHTRQIFDSYSQYSRHSQIAEGEVPPSLRHILTVNKDDVSPEQQSLLISFYLREEIDLRKIKENDEENLGLAKELMYLSDCKKKEKQREDIKQKRVTQAQRRATRNLKILQRALRSQRASAAKMKKRKMANQKTNEKCKKFLARFLSRFNQEEMQEDQEGFVPDKDFNKIKNILKDEKSWKPVKEKLQFNRAELMKYAKAGGEELWELRRKIPQRFYNPESACETNLKELRDEVKEFALNPKEKKDFKLESKLVEFQNSLQGDSEIYWPRVLQLMLFFSLKAQAAFIKMLYEYWHQPQESDYFNFNFGNQEGQEIDCIRPAQNYDFKQVTLLSRENIPDSSLEDIHNEEELLKELTSYAGRLPQFREVRDLNMRRKLYLSEILEFMIEERLDKSMELIFYNDELIIEVISTIRKQRKAEQRREKCKEILLRPITCWADLFERRSKKFKEYEKNIEEQNSGQFDEEDPLDDDLQVDLDRRIVADCKSDEELILLLDMLLKKEAKDPSKITMKCKEAKGSFYLFIILTCLSYFTLISNSLSILEQLSESLSIPSDWNKGGDYYISILIIAVILAGFGSIFLFAQMYRQIMQVGFRTAKATCCQKLQVFIFKLIYTSLFLPLNKLFLKILMCDIYDQSRFRMKIYANMEPNFFDNKIYCFETTYNIIAVLTLLSWLIYFSVGTFVVSKLQFLNRTSPFIVYEGFATMLQLFKFFSVLVIVLTGNSQQSKEEAIATFSVLSILLLVMAIYTWVRKFALHPFARIIHTVGIFLLFATNFSVLIYLATTL